MQRKHFHSKFLSTLLVVVLVLTLFPATPQTAYAADYSVGNLVSFGTYPQTEITDLADLTGLTVNVDYVTSGGKYFRIEPIVWRVLENADNKLFLLSERLLEARAYHNTRVDVTWETSDIRAWLNNGSSGFYGNAFSAAEQGAILTETVLNPDNPGGPTTDNLFFLSRQEAQNSAYGFNNVDDRMAELTAFAKSQNTSLKSDIYGEWWLRSPGNFGNTYAMRVDDDGNVQTGGSYIDRTNIALRPALKFDLTSSVTLTSAVIVPGPPTGVKATAGGGQATVSFTAPVSNGGSPITGYTVTSSDGQTASDTSSPITITGLESGMTYTFTVAATNSVGTGPASAASSAITLAYVPGAPTHVMATAGDEQATVNFTAPVSNGGSPITGYTVTSNPGNITATGTSSPMTITGLTNGTAYTFTVKATNSAGDSEASEASDSVTPVTVPGAPTGVTATAGNEEATVSFTAPADDGGSPITYYTVTSSPGSISVARAASPITVDGLENGTTYTFTVTASNNEGTGPASAPSDPVMPLPSSNVNDPASLDAALNAVTGDGTITLTGDINYTKPIIVTEGYYPSFTLDLGGHKLTITTDFDYGIEVYGGHTLTVQGPGTLDVTGVQYGIYAHDGGTFAVTDGTNKAIVNATATGDDFSVGAYATGGGSTVNVTGDVTAIGVYGRGARADDGCSVIVGGSATGDIDGAYARGTGATVNVTGNVTATGVNGVGADAHEGGNVTVGGNATGGEVGASADDMDSTVNVAGDATGDHDGAFAGDGGNVTVGGNATADKEGTGAVADGGGATVNVAGDAIGDGGAYATNGGSVTVDGSATGIFEGVGAYSIGSMVNVTGDVTGGYTGAFAALGGTVKVTGSITATEEDGYGAVVQNGGEITIDGSITANTYILFLYGILGEDEYLNELYDEVIKTRSDYNTSTTKDGYLTYIEADSYYDDEDEEYKDIYFTVWVKAYTLAYDLSGGTGTAPPIKTDKTGGEALTAAGITGITPPSGKQFKEWNTQPGGDGTSYEAGATLIMPASDLTLYAIWEDETPPTVKTVTPTGTNAAVSGYVVITFSEVMDISTVGTVQLNSLTALTGGTWNTPMNKVFTIPYSGLPHSTAYTVTISGFKDAAGTPMTAVTSGFTFTTVDKANQTAPAAPTSSGKTTTSVTLNTAAGYEYAYSATNSAAGATWQTSGSFTGLTPSTTYYFFARLAETANYHASPASAPLSVTTDKVVDDGKDKTVPEDNTITGDKTAPVLVSISGAVAKEIKDKAYTGKSIGPAPALSINNVALKKGTDYTVSYKNNTKIGKATVTITGKGKYTGTKSITFKIIPQKASVSKLVAGKNQLKVTWKKVSAAQKITKYEVRYKIKGTKKWQTKTASAKSTGLTITKLQKGKAYQIQIRSYKTVSKAKYYSAWSQVKTSGKV
jgi:hypothetical protein